MSDREIGTDLNGETAATQVMINAPATLSLYSRDPELPLLWGDLKRRPQGYGESKTEVLISKAVPPTVWKKQEDNNLAPEALEPPVDASRILVSPVDASRIVRSTQVGTMKLGAAWIDPEEQKLRPLANGTTLRDRFEIMKPIARGGFSYVYFARDNANGNLVAIKEACPATGNRDPSGKIVTSNIVGLALARNCLLSECMYMLRCEHESVLPVNNLFEELGNLFLITPFVQGEQLDQYAKRNDGVSNKRALELTSELAGVTYFLHQKGLIHGDIKPSNIFMRSEKSPLLIDFGSCAPIAFDALSPRIFSPGYAPPEAMEKGGARGEWSDVYSLTATVCSALTAQQPPKDGFTASFVDQINLPRPIQETFKSSLSNDPRVRPQSVTDFLSGCGLSMPSSGQVDAEQNSLFISYARADSDKVYPLVEYLQNRGVSVWIDTGAIQSGRAWAESIAKGISSARYFMVFCSPNSATSESVENEIYLANQKKKPILTTMLEPMEIPDSISFFLAKSQYFEINHDDYDAYLTGILKLLG